jgi:hypothetical protein
LNLVYSRYFIIEKYVDKAKSDMSKALDMLAKAVKGSQALFDVRRK